MNPVRPNKIKSYLTSSNEVWGAENIIERGGLTG